MPKFSPQTIIIFCCAGCILFTLWFKSSLHPITNPSWYRASLLPAATQPAPRGITVHFHERRPLYIAYKNEARGLVANPIGQAFAYADIPFSWQETPASRQLEIIKNNADKSCAAGWFKTAERETFGQFSLPIYQDKAFVAITRADNTLLGDVETLERVFQERRLQVLVKDGYSYGPYIDDHLRRLAPRQVTTTADNQNLMRMIQTYRADYCFMTEEEAQDQLLFSGLKNSDFKLVHFSDMPRGNKRYLICSKKVDQKTMQRLNDALRYVVHLEDNTE
ncbi:substrate-binding periplasmic protein [Desulfocastanea catecholica]